jgi:cold-inducible RNA-binding protein
MAVRLFVGNLPYDTTEPELKELFSQVGPLSFISLPTDRETGKLRGFAFVEFGDRAHAETSIRRFDGQMFKGRRLVVNEARERERGPGLGGPSRPPGPRYDSGPGAGATLPAPGAGKGAGNFGPDAAPKRARKKPKKGAESERRPKRPIPEITRTRYFGSDEEEDQEEQIEDDLFDDNFARRVDGDEDEDKGGVNEDI